MGNALLDKSYASIAMLVKGQELVNIRQYKTSDLEAVLSSWEAATRLAHPFMIGDFLVQEHKNVAEIYMPNTDTWVAELDGHVEGFVALMGSEIGAIFLQPSFHGKVLTRL